MTERKVNIRKCCKCELSLPETHVRRRAANGRKQGESKCYKCLFDDGELGVKIVRREVHVPTGELPVSANGKLKMINHIFNQDRRDPLSNQLAEGVLKQGDGVEGISKWIWDRLNEPKPGSQESLAAVRIATALAKQADERVQHNDTLQQEESAKIFDLVVDAAREKMETDPILLAERLEESGWTCISPGEKSSLEVENREAPLHDVVNAITHSV